MPPDLPNEQALILKKRARRRLVGAIALVLLMIIILPRILQDRATVTSQESIKITMPAQPDDAFSSAVTPLENDGPKATEPMIDDSESMSEQTTEADVENLAAKQAELAISPKAEMNKPEPVKPAPKPANPVVSPKDAAGFTVQVGVFSDAANVKQLQEKLKKAGFSSYTENISTASGQKIRLRAGKFSTRQEASDALNAIKSAGLSGMVISN